jgi:hypothetical protein
MKRFLMVLVFIIGGMAGVFFGGALGIMAGGIAGTEFGAYVKVPVSKKMEHSLLRAVI